MAMRYTGTQNQIARTQALQAYSQPNIDPGIAQQVSRSFRLTVFLSTADLSRFHSMPSPLPQETKRRILGTFPRIHRTISNALYMMQLQSIRDYLMYTPTRSSATRAAFCSASFLLRPPPRPKA